MADEAQGTDPQASNQQAPADPVAPAPEQTSEVKADPAPAPEQAEDPLQPVLDAVKELSGSLSDIVDQVNNLVERVADLEKDVEQIKSAPFEEMLDKAFEAAAQKIGGEFVTLLADMRKIKAKLHHM